MGSKGSGSADGGYPPSSPYLEAEQDAEVPGGHVLDPVEHVHLQPGGAGAHPGILAYGGTAQPWLTLGAGDRGGHPALSPRVAQTAPRDPLRPQGRGGVPAGWSPSDGVLQKDLGWVPCCPRGCPSTHPAIRRQLLPRGMWEARGRESRAPILAARARREPSQCCPGCPMGTGLGSAPGT